MTAADEDLRRRLFNEVREPELRPLAPEPAALAQLLDMQFRGQWSHYQRAYGDGEFCIVEFGGEPIGNWYVWRGKIEYRLIDITLFDSHRGHGIGTHLLQDFCREADEAGLPIILHVETLNPARNLYERHGFVIEELVGAYYRMRRVHSSS